MNHKLSDKETNNSVANSLALDEEKNAASHLNAYTGMHKAPREQPQQHGQES